MDGEFLDFRRRGLDLPAAFHPAAVWCVDEEADLVGFFLVPLGGENADGRAIGSGEFAVDAAVGDEDALGWLQQLGAMPAPG